MTKAVDHQVNGRQPFIPRLAPNEGKLVEEVLEKISKNGGLSREIMKIILDTLSSAGINQVLNRISESQRQKYFRFFGEFNRPKT